MNTLLRTARNCLRLAMPLALLLVLTGCSFTLRGVITDVTTGQPVEGATVSVVLGDDNEDRTSETNDEGAYRIKKDDRAQEVAFMADGFETFSTTLTNERERDVFLIPTPSETARRIVGHLRDSQYEETYNYLHPNYRNLLTQDQFEQEMGGGFSDLLALVTDFRIDEVTTTDNYRDDRINKTYNNVVAVQVILEMENGGSTFENAWTVHLQQVRGEDDRLFYHWLFNRTTNPVN